jgi:16S rRNA (cytidine1402-2'-O)-methyltransferase
MLYVVATPIGNLEDVTLRALRTLKEVDLIAAEDTRRTAKLLTHYKIRRPVISLREHNEVRETPRLLARLERGESIALVSDAGTPGISDPGARLVRSARERNIPVTPIPGPSAIAAAVSASGFPADEFVFLGFPPRGGEARREWFAKLQEENRTTVFFESPHRIRQTLTEAQTSLGKRPICVARELTKLHEEWVESPIKLLELKDAGEFTVVISPSAGDEDATRALDADAVVELFGRLTNLAGVEDSKALDLVAAAFIVPVSSVRKIIKKHKISVKQQIQS